MNHTSLLSILTLVLLTTASAVGAAPPELHRQVLEMLEADLSEEVVLDWLEGIEAPQRRPTSEELIALKKAGASDRLLKALIALSRDDVASNRTEATTPPASGSIEPQPPTVSPVPETSSIAETLVTFKLSYEAPKVDFDEELWDLYVYLDGEPLAYVPPSFTPLDRDKALEFKQRLTPGRHVVRVAQERHERRRGGRWRHEARVSGQEFAFELLAGQPAELELAYREGWLSNHSDGPLRFRLAQEDRVTELEWVGGNPERWPALCEELETKQDGDRPPSRALRRELESCVRWSELWREVGAPSREAVRQALEMFDYRPVPRGT